MDTPADAAFTYFLATSGKDRMSLVERRLFDFFKAAIVPEAAYVEFPTGAMHGTKSSYDRQRCRCDRCRAANTESQRRYRQRKQSAGKDLLDLSSTSNPYTTSEGII